MLLKTETYKHQQAITNYCRDGVEVAIKGTVAERLPHYRRLIFNVVNDAIESSFPIAYKYVKREYWDEMVYDFFKNHSCSDPQVWRMPFEFYGYVMDNKLADKYEIPWLNDLLYFEWLEVEVYMMEDKEYPSFSDTTEWFDKLVAVNPEHQLIKLEYPVHKEIPENAKDAKGDCFLLLFRQAETGKVQFVELSVLYTFIIENIVEGKKTLHEIMNDVLYFFGINDMEMLQKNTHVFLSDLKSKGFVLGIMN